MRRGRQVEGRAERWAYARRPSEREGHAEQENAGGTATRSRMKPPLAQQNRKTIGPHEHEPHRYHERSADEFEPALVLVEEMGEHGRRGAERNEHHRQS